MSIKFIFMSLVKEQRKLKNMEREFNLQKRIVENLRKSMVLEMSAAGTTTFSGKGGRLSLRTSVIPVVEDWDKVYEFIHAHSAFDLLERRISKTAYRDRLEEGEKIPGTSTFDKDTLYITLSE